MATSAKLPHPVGFPPDKSIEKAAGNILFAEEPPLWAILPSQSEPPHISQEVAVAGSRRFTRIPKTTQLIHAGVPAEAISTYCCLADYANNKTGLCWPKMETLAQTLNRSVRTIQRHLHLLRELGLIEFVERRRHKGRFSSYLYRVLHIVATTGHGRPVGRGDPNKRRTKHLRTPPKSPSKSVTEGYEWLFGEKAPPEEQQAHDREQKQKREEEAKRRRDGYEWFFT